MGYPNRLDVLTISVQLVEPIAESGCRGARHGGVARIESFPAPMDTQHSHTQPDAPPTAERSHELAWLVAAVLGYAGFAIWGLYLAGPSGLSSWYPAAGLATAAVARGGIRFALVPLVGTMAITPLPAVEMTGLEAVLVGLSTSAGATAGGLALRSRLDPARPLADVRDAWLIIGIGAAVVPLVTAAVALLGTVASGLGTPSSAWLTARDLLVGDAVGTLTVTPLLLVSAAAWQRGGGVRMLLPPRNMLHSHSLIAVAALVVIGPALFALNISDMRAVGVLPLCWLALRFGIVGTVVGTFTWSISSAVLLTIVGPRPELASLQGFLLTGTTLSLLIGAVVSERIRTQRELRFIAMHERVTGLPNEPHLLELLDSALHLAGSREVTTMLVRLSAFRPVAAHLRADEQADLLEQMIGEIEAAAGPAALIARPGFDRFAVLFSGGTAERRRQIAERIADRLSNPLAVGGREVFVDPRVGVTVARAGENAEAVFAHAHHAADAALVGSSERVGYFDAETERLRREREELAEDLRVAVEQGDFLLAFQPIVTAKEGVVVGAEALLRWVDQRRGPVSPADFVPVAEETGLILPIGRWVLNEACRRAAHWPHVAGAPISVSVNISPIQLMDDGFVTDVAAALERSGLPANRLRIEITEGIAMEDIDRTIAQITQLRDLGVETMLDDFGTGHSSLAWVQRLPVSCIKIDRAFVNDVAVDGIDRAIVHASLYLSRALGTETVAEGVETEAQREQLVRMGCQKLQGYLFARPQPADVFPVWLERQRAKAASSNPPRTAAESSPLSTVVPQPLVAPTPSPSQEPDVHVAAWGTAATAAPAAPAARPYQPTTAMTPRPQASPADPDRALRAVPASDPRFAA